MALAAATVLEVRALGADTNGGGWVTGASGTDFSQQNAAQFALTNVTTAAANAICLSASAAATMVGNICQIISGTNFTAGFYQILSVSVGVSFTVDRNCTTAAGALGVINIGGALASPGQAGAVATVAGMTVYIGAGTYSITSSSSNVAAGIVGVATATSWQGYNGTRGTLTAAPLLQASGISSVTIFTHTAGSCEFINIAVDGASLTSMQGFALNSNGNNAYCYLLTAKNCTNIGITAQRDALIKCTATGCSGGAAAISAITLFMCEAYTNTITGISIQNNGMAAHCLAYGNSGGSSDGFLIGSGSQVSNCDSYGNGRDAFRITNTGATINCIAEGNTGVGFKGVGGVYAATFSCATYNNTGGATSGLSAASAVPTVLSASPFVNAAGSNFALNSTAGGAAARAAGIPGLFPDGLSTGSLDMGAVQHQDPIRQLTMLGGMNA